MPKLGPVVSLILVLARPALAEPGFATPPGGPLAPSAPPDDREPPPRTAEREPDGGAAPTIVRLSIGPGLRVSDAATDGGLCAVLDAGSGPVGVRATGTWVRVGSVVGMSAYGGDLWIDFAAGHRLHPILGAGATLARISQKASDGSSAAATYGAGTLRGTLEYELPVERADARAGVDLQGAVPAIQSRHAADVGPWLLVAARVGIGF